VFLLPRPTRNREIGLRTQRTFSGVGLERTQCAHPR